MNQFFSNNMSSSIWRRLALMKKKSSIIAHPKSSIATFLIAREIKMLTNVLNVWSLTNQRAPTNLILGSSNAFEHKNLSFEFEFWFHYGLWPITDQQLISLWSLTNHRPATHFIMVFDQSQKTNACIIIFYRSHTIFR